MEFSMGSVYNSSKYIFRVAILVIVVIINIIAIISVVSTVGKTVKELRVNISTGKISGEKSQVYSNQIDENEILSQSSDFEEDIENDLDFGILFKTAIKDKEVLKSIILMVIALLLLAGAVFILVKLK